MTAPDAGGIRAAGDAGDAGDAGKAGDARAVECAALAWLSAHRDGFTLGEDALSADGQVNFTWKPLGELAQVCVTVQAHPALRPRARPRRRGAAASSGRRTPSGSCAAPGWVDWPNPGPSNAPPATRSPTWSSTSPTGAATPRASPPT